MRYWRQVKKSDAEDQDPLVDQIAGLARYVKDARETEVQSSMVAADFAKKMGDAKTDQGKNAKAAIDFMKRQPEGTQFAVLTAKVDKDVKRGVDAHWIYAEIHHYLPPPSTSGKIIFKDFQLDRPSLQQRLADLKREQDELEKKGEKELAQKKADEAVFVKREQQNLTRRFPNLPDAPVEHVLPLAPNNTTYKESDAILMFALAFGEKVVE